MPKPKLVPPPDFQGYNCHGCGTCCRGFFEVAITPEERDRIEAQGWRERPEFADVELFRGGEQSLALANREDGSCVFLGDDGLCRIHAEFGEPTKPLACRMYPFVFVPAGNEVRVDVRFDCPSVAGSQGMPLPDHQPALRGMLKEALPAEAGALESPGLSFETAADWPVLRRVTQAFDRLIADISLDLPKRMLACADLAEQLRYAPLEALDQKERELYLTEAVREIVERRVAEEIVRRRPSRIHRVLFRQLVAIYGRADRIGETPNVLARLKTSLRMVLGHGLIPRVREDFPAVRFAQMEPSEFELPQPAVLAITRYYRVKLAGLGFCGAGFYRYPLVEGLEAMLLVYPLLAWYARYFAAGAGREQPEVGDVLRAIQIVDHAHGRNPWLNMAGERRRRETLCESDTLRELIAWYGA